MARILGQEHYYMQRIDIQNEKEFDIEQSFINLRILRCEKVNSIGKTKNVYTETYAEAQELRVHLPEDGKYANEALVHNLVFIVFGDNPIERESTFKKFVEYVRTGKHKYRDAWKKLTFDFIVTDEIEPSDEKWDGDIPYIEGTIPLQNLRGTTQLI